MPEWFKGSSEDSVRAATSSSQISYILVCGSMGCLCVQVTLRFLGREVQELR